MNRKNDFEKLVEMAMSNPNLSTMRPVVEKELLHYEVFQALDGEGLLKDLVFQGGTALRLCRGSERFSEDLDFAGGVDFSANKMEKIKACVEKHVGDRFGLRVEVSLKPARGGADKVKVDRWWISIETSPENPAMPRQRIKLEIANIRAHTRELLPLLANYESVIAMPTIMVNTEHIDEIMADKILAFPTSLQDNQGLPVGLDSKKIRHRDIWDLAWLIRKGAKLKPELVAAKVGDYGVDGYDNMLVEALARIPDIVKSPPFKEQMSRFIDSTTVGKMLSTDAHLNYFSTTVSGLFSRMQAELANALQSIQTRKLPPDTTPVNAAPKPKKRQASY